MGVTSLISSPELEAVSKIADIEPILEVCARTTGMGYCVVAHVTEDRWLACAVLDNIDFGLPVGGELPIKTTLCNEVRERQETIAFDHASADDRWRTHSTPTTYGLESYIAAPIILADGSFFGTLCAIDPKPAPASRPDIITMFELFAKLIANNLDASRRVAISEAALLDEKETAKLRDQFIAVLGHDLRNPLAAVEAGLGMLRRRLVADERTSFILDDMKRSSERMTRLINDILDFARGRLGGGLPLVRQRSATLSAQLLQIIAELSASNQNRKVIAQIPDDMIVRCDPDRIAQMLSNLLGNALTHGDENVPITVTANADADVFELVVANGGKAIPADILPGLFLPFNRGESSDHKQGLGLGLYICSQIATAHQGKLSVQSNDLETRFTFRMRC